MDWMLPGCQEQRRLGRKLFLPKRYDGTKTGSQRRLLLRLTPLFVPVNTLHHVNTESIAVFVIVLF